MTAMPMDLHLSSGAVDKLAAAPSEWAKLRNWLMVWLVLANIAFAPMWFVGSPPRFLQIVAGGVVGLLVRRAPLWVQMAAFLAVLTFSALSFIAGVFNLPIFSVLASLRFVMELQPAQSLEYIVGGVAVFLVGLGAWLLMRRDSGFDNWRLVLIGVGATLALAFFDLAVGYGSRGQYKQAPAADAPFESAMTATGAEQNAIANGRNLAVIMVESMGVPAGNPEMERLLFSGLDTPEIADQFTVSRGTSLYYISTTAAEMRELCGRWGDYYELLDTGGDPSCLPNRMRQAGYASHALHSFHGEFFDREVWYPTIGFDTSRFSHDLLSEGAEFCGGVFAGACDRDIPALLAEQLKSSEQPQFVYWLTVNSHLPVPTQSNLNVDDCATFSADLARDYPMICRQFYIWDQIEKALVKEVSKPGFPPTDFLIVGDHMPPYYDRRYRREFDPDRVPYIYLQWRGDDKIAIRSEKGEDG